MRTASPWIPLFLGTLLACGGASNPPPPPQGPQSSTVDPNTATALAGRMTTLAPQLASRSLNHALALEAAAVALQAGSNATPVNVTASAVAGGFPGVRGEALVSGAGLALGVQLVVQNAPGSTGPLTLSGAVLMVDPANFVVAVGPSPSSPIPPAVGVLVAGGTDVWAATAGSESAQLQSESGNCPRLIGLPPEVTGCKLAIFQNAGFSIGASSPAAGNASGSRIASIQAAGLVGASLTVDCARGTLCAQFAGGTVVSVTVNPLAATLRPGGTQQFTALINGLQNSDVTWSVSPQSGGTISSSGLFTAGQNTGAVTVTATSVTTPTKSGRATVTIAPSTMTLTATALAPTLVGLSWSAVPSANIYLVTRIERGSPFGLPGTSGLTLRDGDLTSGTAYGYEVKAFQNAILLDSATATVTTPATGGTIVFTDSEFVPGGWTDGKSEGSSVSATAVSAQQVSGGNPGAFRTNDLHLVGTSVLQWNAKTSAVHTPSIGGKVLSVDVEFDLKVVSGGIERYDLYIAQNGKRYYSDRRAIPATSGAWTHFSFHDILAQDLLEANGSTVIADFAGSLPMTFGYIAAVSSPTPADFDKVVGIDNWKVTLHLAP